MAIGVVVDDTIIDVENIARRLRQNRARAPAVDLRHRAEASVEVRTAITYATLIKLRSCQTFARSLRCVLQAACSPAGSRCSPRW